MRLKRCELRLRSRVTSSAPTLVAELRLAPELLVIPDLPNF